MYGFLSQLSLCSIPHYTWSLSNGLISEEILYPAPKHIPQLGDLYCMPSPKSLALDGYRLFPALQRFPGRPTGFPPWVSSELGRTKKNTMCHSFWHPPEKWGWTNSSWWIRLALFPLETGTRVSYFDCWMPSLRPLWAREGWGKDKWKCYKAFDHFSCLFLDSVFIWLWSTFNCCPEFCHSWFFCFFLHFSVFSVKRPGLEAAYFTIFTDITPARYLRSRKI